MLYHISEEPGIAIFQPRLANNVAEPVVWAVSGDRLRNYLLPRDCPRVTFFAGQRTTSEDRQRLLGASEAVVAFESAWLARVQSAKIFCYHLPADGFVCVDECAGYFQNTREVKPVGMEVIDDCLAELVARNVEIRILPSLWPLRDAVVASSVSYSIIRMRNAAGREA